MSSTLPPYQVEARELGPLALYGETEKLLDELGSIRLSAVPSTPLPSLVSVCVHLHAFATQQGFILKAEFSASRRLFKCTRFRNQSLDGGRALCDAFFEVIEMSSGWTIGRMRHDHSHALEKDSLAQVRMRARWKNLQLPEKGENSGKESNGEPARHQRRVLSKQGTYSSRRRGSGSSSESIGESESESDTQAGTVWKSGLKASHWNFPMSQRELVDEADAILSETRSPPPFPSIDNGVCYPTAREFRIQSFAAARAQGFSLATYDADSKRSIERNEFRLRCAVRDTSTVIKSCGALMTVGCRKGDEGSDEWYVVKEDSHLYHVVDTKWKGKGRMGDPERVKTPSTVPLKRYPSSSTFTPPSNSRSPSGIPPTKMFRPSPASTSQPRQTNSTKPSSSSLPPEAQPRFDAPFTPAALPTSSPVSHKSLTEFLYFLSPNLATFGPLLHHRGVNNFDALLLLLEQDKTTLATFYNSLGSLTDLEKSSGSKVMPLLSASLLSSKLKEIKSADQVAIECVYLD